jgi:hypothetical protein
MTVGALYVAPPRQRRSGSGSFSFAIAPLMSPSPSLGKSTIARQRAGMAGDDVVGQLISKPPLNIAITLRSPTSPSSLSSSLKFIGGRPLAGFDLHSVAT